MRKKKKGKICSKEKEPERISKQAIIQRKNKCSKKKHELEEQAPGRILISPLPIPGPAYGT